MHSVSDTLEDIAEKAINQCLESKPRMAGDDPLQDGRCSCAVVEDVTGIDCDVPHSTAVPKITEPDDEDCPIHTTGTLGCHS